MGTTNHLLKCRGVIEIERFRFKTHLPVVQRFFIETGFVPYHAVDDPLKVCIRYFGFSFKFDPIPDLVKAPCYQLMIHSNNHWSFRRQADDRDRIWIAEEPDKSGRIA